MQLIIDFLSRKRKRRFSFRPSLTLPALIGLLAFTSPIFAQPKITLTPPKNGKLDSLVPVMAHSARVAAVGDIHGMLAFGHDHTFADAHVSLVKLDAKGNPAAYAMQLKLPKPVALVKN